MSHAAARGTSIPEPTLPEQIARKLRRDILRGVLAPGAAVKERDNAARLGVSRTPMREAIRILAKEGLLMLRPSRSPVVAQPTFREISDWVEVLLALETLSAELACRHASAAEIADLRRITASMDARFDIADPLDIFEIDMRFHTGIARASHNAALAETHGAYLARLWRARFLSAAQRRNRARVVTDHSRILDTIEARDGAAARSAIDFHLGHLAEDIRAAIEAEESAARPPRDLQSGE
ncbi:GntR family transcriptional regulator [Roseivivax halodurans JCM 10272]|uniref:GntR family transcriptional regulator n=1 Tax=Roseivivax halodurans JCM 10272 TaxID=1449350 RepID=X7ED09_9RHOB|nr:GntR family transcriptional regulator [Roseivivax halodurans]ETX12998.1 GntR family transcriptional regulator [Roseivivax halodurans JCM 10272]